MRRSALFIAPLLLFLAGCASIQPLRALEVGTRHVDLFTAESHAPVDLRKIPHIVLFLRRIAAPNRPEIRFDHAALIDVLEFLDTQTHDTRLGLSLGPPLPHWPYGDWIHQLSNLDDLVSLELRDTSLLELWFQMSLRTGCPLVVKVRRIQYEELNGKKVDEARPYLMLVDKAACGSVGGEAYFSNFSPRKCLDHVKECNCGTQKSPACDAPKAAPEK